MAERARTCRAVHVDFGTGDGAFAYRLAKLDPDLLVVGVDASADGLRDVSRRALRKTARGGAPNALFARLALETAPGALEGLADGLTIHLPWASLLRAVALPEVQSLARLRALCRPGAAVRVAFGYDPVADAAMIRDLGLPALDPPSALEDLTRAYARTGLAVTARPLSLGEVLAIPTTWAKKLAHAGGRRRAFVELSGHATGE